MFIAEETKNDVKKIKTEDIQLDDLLGILYLGVNIWIVYTIYNDLVTKSVCYRYI